MRTFYLLGAHDEEMKEIRDLLFRLGAEYAVALKDGHRVRRGEAYEADSATRPIPEDARLVTVECGAKGLEVDLEIDHHFPGDPGYDAPPEKFWEGSSLGQIVADVMANLPEKWDEANLSEGELLRLKMVAAADHCLGAAYAGKCPGIVPMKLRMERAKAVVKRHGGTIRRVFSTQERTGRHLLECPRVNLGGDIVAIDARALRNAPFLNEAACLFAGGPVLARRSNKVVILNADPRSVIAFKLWATAEGASDTYGSPTRGFGGATFPTLP